MIDLFKTTGIKQELLSSNWIPEEHPNMEKKSISSNNHRYAHTALHIFTSTEGDKRYFLGYLCDY